MDLFLVLKSAYLNKCWLPINLQNEVHMLSLHVVTYTLDSTSGLGQNLLYL